MIQIATWLLLTAMLCYANEVVLSAGIGGYNSTQLWSQYTAFKTYSTIGIISTASILSYYLAVDGSLAVYQTADPSMSAEQYQSIMTSELGLKSIPCIYCDATLGNCQNLSQRLENLYQNQQAFIVDSLNRAKTYGFSGYYLDLEPDSVVNSTQLTDFVFDWGYALQQNDLSLTLWIGGDTQYDNDRIFNSTVFNLVTMNTYNTNYADFIAIAAPLQTSINNVSRIGFGLLTNYGTNDVSDIDQIALWSLLTKTGSLSLWASHIPPEWYFALSRFNEN